MKVRFLQNGVGVGMAYFAGDICDIPELKARELISFGYLEELPETKPEAPKPDLPDDMPGKIKLLNAQIATLSELKNINDLTEINGIGKTLAKQIKDYINERGL